MNKKLKKNFIFLFLLLLTVFIVSSCSNIKSTKIFEEGKRYLAKKQYNKAIDSFKKVLEINPKNHQAVEAIAICYGNLKDFKTATTYFEKAVDIKPRNKLYLFNLAITYLKTEKYEKAKEIYQRILYLDKDNKTAKEALENLRKKGY